MGFITLRFRISQIVGLVLSILLLALLTLTTNAQSLTTCEWLNDSTYDGLYGGRGVGGFYAANDRVTISAGYPETVGISTQITLTLDGTIVAIASFPGTITYTIAFDGNYLLNWSVDSSNVTWDISCENTTSPEDPGGGGGSDAMALESEVDPSPIPAFFDGRINDFDTGNSVVLFGINYGDDQWGLEVYNADSTGLLFNVTPEQIATVPECPDSNTLIYADEATGISLWRLPQRPDGTCPFQLNAPTGEPGKVYIIVFDTLYPGTYYESWEEFIIGD